MTDPGAPRIADYLEHILQAIRRIYRYTEEMDETGFTQDERTQDAVIRNFEIIGEAAPLEEYLENIERQAILNALDQAGNNKTVAAKLPGISFRTMRYTF